MYNILWGSSSGIHLLIKEHPASLFVDHLKEVGVLVRSSGRLVVVAECRIDSALGSSGIWMPSAENVWNVDLPALIEFALFSCVTWPIEKLWFPGKF